MPKTMTSRSEHSTRTAITLQALALAAMEYHNALLDAATDAHVIWRGARANVLLAAVEFARASREEMEHVTASIVPPPVTRTGDTART